MQKPPGHHRSVLRVLALLVGFLGLCSPLIGQIVGQKELAGFEPSSEYQLKLDDEPVADVEIFFSDKEVAYLLLSPVLKAPISISPRGNSVERIEAGAVTVSSDRDSATIAAGASAESLPNYTKFRGVMSFEIDGVTASLEPTPPILGRHTPETLRFHDRALAHDFRKALPNSLAKSRFSALKSSEAQVLVRIFFGSWNEYSSTVLPKIMRLEQDLAGSGIDFEYHGLDKGFTEDPVAREHSVQGLPTAVVMVDGTERGRLKGRQLYDPATSLERLLDAAGAPSSAN